MYTSSVRNFSKVGGLTTIKLSPNKYIIKINLGGGGGGGGWEGGYHLHWTSATTKFPML